MSRIQQLFKNKEKDVLSIYVTAGYPRLHDTINILQSLQVYGADMIEIGIPYSDPLADGPVIQESSSVAIENGMTIESLFIQLKRLRDEVAVPVVLMGYLNPVLQFGFEKFCSQAAELGVDGLIIPDLPLTEFEKEYGPIIRKYGLDFIFLITPETPEDRVRKLDSLSSGFLYAVSSSSTTGSAINENAVEDYLKRINEMQLQNPVLAGFGIHDRASFQRVCKHTNGAIIGSAFIKALKNSENTDASTKAFLTSVTG